MNLNIFFGRKSIVHADNNANANTTKNITLNITLSMIVSLAADGSWWVLTLSITLPQVLPYLKYYLK